MRNKTIGVVSSWSGLSTSIFETAKIEGYSVLFHVLELDVIESFRDFENEDLDAYIFISTTPDTIRIAERLYQEGKAVIVLLRESEICPVLTVDTQRASTEAVDYLVQLGHKDILFVTATENEQGRLRLKGYLDGLEKNGIPRNDELIIDCVSFGATRTSEMVSKWIANKKPATAVLFSNRSQAVDGISVFFANNFKIPEDIAVVTIDEPTVGPEWIKTISCWRLPMKEIGKIAVESITQQLEGTNVRPTNQNLNCQRLIRESCGGRQDHLRSSLKGKNIILSPFPEGIPLDLKKDVTSIDEAIVNALKNPSTLSDSILREFNNLEKMGMEISEGLKILTRCQEYCLKTARDNDRAAYSQSFHAAFHAAFQAHAHWLSTAYYRTDKEREGLTRADLFYPQNLSKDDKPNALIDGLKQHLIARGSTRFIMQLRSWDKQTYTIYEWNKTYPLESSNVIQETEGKTMSPGQAFLELRGQQDCGLFNLCLLYTSDAADE